MSTPGQVQWTITGEPGLRQQLRALNLHYCDRQLSTGSRRLVLECTGAGELGIDCLRVRPERR